MALEVVAWAKTRLHSSAKALLADFLILKREGLRVGSSIIITSVSTAESARRLLGIERDDGSAIDSDRYYHNPFANVNPWRHDEYPRSGTYTTIERSKSLHTLMEVNRAGGGIEIALKDDYVERLQSAFRVRANAPVAIPSMAFATWCSRYDEIPEGLDSDQLVTQVFAEYGITNEEAAALFVKTSDYPTSIFIDSKFPANAFIELLGGNITNDASSISPAVLVPSEETAEESLPDDLLEFLRGTLLLSPSLLRQIVTLIRSGKHIILTGPPGTGKTTLVYRLAEASRKASAKYLLPSSEGALFTTATADWSTFDTLGGYVPDPTSGKLSFHEGIFLEAIRENSWVVIDELNRADVDKAFGQFFTLLSWHDVRTPFHDKEDPVKLVFDQNSSASSREPTSATYVLGSDWRLLATMNTFDCNLLFQLSAAFVRRFAIVYVGIPPIRELKTWIGQRDLAPEELSDLQKLMDIVTDVRPLGPAIWSDVADYISDRSADPIGMGGRAPLLEAVTAFVLPQMDGLNADRLAFLKRALLEVFAGDDEKLELGRLFEELF